MRRHREHTPADYRERAAECERLAETAVDEANRKILLDLAARWRALANENDPPKKPPS